MVIHWCFCLIGSLYFHFLSLTLDPDAAVTFFHSIESMYYCHMCFSYHSDPIHLTVGRWFSCSSKADLHMTLERSSLQIFSLSFELLISSMLPLSCFVGGLDLSIKCWSHSDSSLPTVFPYALYVSHDELPFLILLDELSLKVFWDVYNFVDAFCFRVT